MWYQAVSFDLGAYPSRDAVAAGLASRLSSWHAALGQPGLVIYGDLGPQRIWLGVRELGRLRVGQLVFHGELVAHEGRWALQGTMRPSLSLLLNFGVFVLLSVVSLIAAAYGFIRLDGGERMILLAPIVFCLVTWAIYKAIAAGARADVAILRRWLLAS